jgi:hypothetical protein
VPVTDAPNVDGARDLGFAVGAGHAGAPDTTALRAAIDAGVVQALYVIHPGPDGSAGDLSWIPAARDLPNPGYLNTPLRELVWIALVAVGPVELAAPMRRLH